MWCVWPQNRSAVSQTGIFSSHIPAHFCDFGCPGRGLEVRGLALLQNESQGLGSLTPFKGVIFLGHRSPGSAQLQLEASVVLENVSYLKEAHWSNHMFPTPHCGAALCSPSAAHSTSSEPTPEPAPHLRTHNYNTHSYGDSHAIEHHVQKCFAFAKDMGDSVYTCLCLLIWIRGRLVYLRIKIRKQWLTFSGACSVICVRVCACVCGFRRLNVVCKKCKINSLSYSDVQESSSEMFIPDRL